MKEERLKILNLLEDGKIKSEEALRLLDALESGEKKSYGKGYFLKVRIYEKEKNSPTVKVNVPLSVAKLASKLSSKFMPKKAKEELKSKGINIDEEGFAEIEKLIDGFAGEGRFNIVDVVDEKEGQRVEVYIE